MYGLALCGERVSCLSVRANISMALELEDIPHFVREDFAETHGSTPWRFAMDTPTDVL
jgi:hypothetical protein